MNSLRKKRPYFSITFLTFISVLLFAIGFQNIHAQKAKKHKIRLKATYVKVMNDEMYLNIKASSKIKKKNVKIPNIELTIFNEVNDEKIVIGNAITNTKGRSKFIIKKFQSLKADSTNTYTIKVAFKGNEFYKKASKRVHFKDADIKAVLLAKDSTNFIKATLTDNATNTPISDESLTVQVQRLFSPLRIGKEFNNTDDKGTIIVSVKEKIPSADGNLILEVVLNDSDEYGTVKALINTSTGVQTVNESSFDQRTMWSPQNKTPLFILVFTNLLIVGIWGILLYLIINLFKISKSKI